MAIFREYLPRGNTLDDATFRQRHNFLSWVLALHLPALALFGIVRGYGVPHSTLEIVTPAACLLFARVARNRRVAAFFVTAGLVFCSSVLVHLSGGMIEAHFHFFVLIGLIALYQDWVPFVWNVVFTVLSHGIGSVLAGGIMFDHPAGQNRPWTWAAIHGVAVLAACVGEIIFWKNTEDQQRRNAALAAEFATVRTEAEQRQSVSELFVNLARRNQSLLDRQLELIGELEQRERDPDQLGDLFALDHLATRIRRNAESLLVLSGDEPPRRWGRSVPLSEVVRAAAAEVEDYRRVEVLVNEHLEVTGRAVADLAHLLAELIENATTFSPPTADVRVRSHLVPGEWSTFVLSVEDLGIGMSEDDIQGANRLLTEPPEVDLRRSSKLGFHVVARLAQRYGIQVRLAHTPGGGVTALVSLPNDLVSERRQRAPVTAGARAGAAGSRLMGPATDGRLRSPVVAAVSAVPDVLLAPGAPVNGHGPTGRYDGHEPTDRHDGHRGLNGHGHRPGGGSGGSGGGIGPAGDGGGTGTTGPGGPRLLDAPRNGHGVPGGNGHPAGSAVNRAGSGWGASDTAELDLPPDWPPEAMPPEPEGQTDDLDRRVPGASLRTPPPPEAPAADAVGATAPAGPAPAAAGEGLARRVPGAGLSPSLRRGPAQRPARVAPVSQDRDRVRSMLSRFQAGQRAGRAAAGDPADALAPEEDR